MLQSPLNYTGGKFKLLSQILPHFPQNINTFVDLFCGGGNVGINVQCRQVLFNDINHHVIGILEAFKRLNKDDIFQTIQNTIEEYHLSLSSSYGYKHYLCNSKDGLSKYNRSAFLSLKNHWNNLNKYDDQYYILLYVLVVYSFNNQIRFNRKGHFNLPVGKRDFNRKMQNKLERFINRFHEIECYFSRIDFQEFDINILDENDFVYIDPPYLITCATYNEQGGWNNNLERRLYTFLDDLHAHNIRFALSNVLTSKGRVNSILQEWLANNAQYHCIHLDYNYSNSSYHTIDREAESDEVLIINY